MIPAHRRAPGHSRFVLLQHRQARRLCRKRHVNMRAPSARRPRRASVTLVVRAGSNVADIEVHRARHAGVSEAAQGHVRAARRCRI